MGINRRWFYLVIAVLLMHFLGLIYAWSIFRAPFSDMFPEWTVSQMSLTFTISMIFFCLGSFAGGLMSKRTSLRARFLISALVLFIGFFAISMVRSSAPSSSLILLYVFYGVFGGGGVGFAYNTLIGTINKWFPDKVGLASGIMLMGYGLGGLVLGSAVLAMIGSSGLNAVFKMLGAAIAAVCTAAAFIIRMPDPAESVVLSELTYSSSASGIRQNAEEDTSAIVDYTPGAMLRTGKFWYFTLWEIMLNSAGLLVINSAADISIAFGGTAVLGMIVSLFNGAGRIVAGNNFDRFGCKTATVANNIFMLIAGIILVLGSVTGSYMCILCGLVFVGLATGGCPTITSAYINKAFGPANFQTNFSLACFHLIPAATIGPMISATLLEAAEGSYKTNFYAIIGFSITALIMCVLMNLNSKDSEKHNGTTTV